MFEFDLETKGKLFFALSHFLKENLKTDLQKVNWKPMVKSLEEDGIPASRANAVVYWASNYVEVNRMKSSSHRILHEMEKDLITSEAYGVMLEALSLGLIESNQTEFLLEEIAIKEDLPISVGAMKNMLINTWFNNFKKSGVLNSN